MEDYRDSQTCKVKTGLLFLRDCGSMVVNQCIKCGRPICRAHSIESEQGIICPECAAPEKKYQNVSGVKSSAQRQELYNNHGYAPYYYGYYHYYSDNDYKTFDNREIIHENPPEDAPDFGSDDDYMES
jgi:DNA-directed RNA polymerase subunit RPC12/RpoP